MKLVRFIRVGVVLSVLPLAATFGSLGSIAGAAGSGYGGTPPVLHGPGGGTFPVVTVIPLSVKGARVFTHVDGAGLEFVIPRGLFSAGDQLVIANSSHSATVPGRKKIFSFDASVYRMATPLSARLSWRYNVIVRSPQINLGDRVFRLERARWILDKSFRIVKGKIVVGVGTSGVVEVVGPKLK